MPRWLNIANGLTVLRLLLVPLVVYAVLDGRHAEALQMFTAAAITNVLDGYLARRFGLATPVGAYLDPIADKCLLSGVFLALAAAGLVPRWMVVIIFGRDVYILAGAIIFLALTSIRKFPPSVWGKLSTFVQVVTVVTLLTRNALQIPTLETLGDAMLWLSALVALWSGIHYTWRSILVVRTH